MKYGFRSSLIAACALVAYSAAPAQADDSLYRAFGGKPGLERLAADFLDIMLADERVAFSFEESDHDRFREKFALQLCELTGGPCVYDGLSMQESHAPFAFSNMHFNAVVEDLQKAMTKQKIPFRTQNRLLKLLAPMQRDIVAK